MFLVVFLQNFGGFQIRDDVTLPEIDTSHISLDNDMMKEEEHRNAKKNRESSVVIQETNYEDNNSLPSMQEKRLECPTFTTQCSYDPLLVRYASWVLIGLVYNGFLIGAVLYAVEKSNRLIDWCNGVGFLIVVTSVAYVGLFYQFVVKRLVAKWMASVYFNKDDGHQCCGFIEQIFAARWICWLLSLMLAIAIVTFLAIDCQGQMHRMVSLLGVGLVLVVNALFSKKPRKIRWRTVISCVTANFLFCLAVHRWDSFAQGLLCLFEKSNSFLSVTNAGTRYMAGPLVGHNSTTDLYVHSGPMPRVLNLYWVNVVGRLFFVNFVFAMLQHHNILPWLVENAGWFCQVVFGTGKAESVCGLFHMFMGPCEPFLAVKPYVRGLTTSELNTAMTVGLATVASMNVFADFSPSILTLVPAAKIYLACASVMSVFSAVAVSKILWPEKKQSVVIQAAAIEAQKITTTHLPSANSLDAALRATTGTSTLVLNVCSTILAWTAFVYMTDEIVFWIGTLFGTDQLSFAFIGEHLLPPFLWILGITWSQSHTVSRLVALKVSTSDLVALESMASLYRARELDERNAVLSLYLLANTCHALGVALIASTLATLTPDRRSLMSQMVLRSFVGALMASFLSTATVGTILDIPVTT